MCNWSIWMYHQRKNVKRYGLFWQSSFRDQMKKMATLFDIAIKLFEYHSAVHGYHYYKKYWLPTEGQTLDYRHEKDNLFEFFAIKVMEQNSGKTVGGLPMENSWATKFLLDLVARIIAKLTSCNYCFLFLVQAWLETLCQVEIYIVSTVENKRLIIIYTTYVDLLYYEWEKLIKWGHSSKEK